MCCKQGDTHLIFLSTYGNKWSQWAYQFAHEYCHHLICGPLAGDLCGLKWFEETICEVSSLYNIYMLYLRWSASSKASLLRFAPHHLDYLHHIIHGSQSQVPLSIFLRDHLESLEGKEYQREAYQKIAVGLFPLFVHNPYVWKIILHFGDTSRFHSLSELFSLLIAQSDKSYRQTLLDIQRLLFQVPSY